jgi:hypothetical protein
VGDQYGLPQAISGHNSYWWWGPGSASDNSTTITINLPSAYLKTIFTRIVPAGTVQTPHNVWTEERNDPSGSAQGKKMTWSTAWPSVRHDDRAR